MSKAYLLNKIAEKKKQPSATAKPAAASTPTSSAKRGNTLLYNASTQQDEAYRDPTLKKNQVAARVAPTATPTVNSANTVQAAARGTVTGARLTAPKSPILQATAGQAAPTAEPSEKKTVSKLAAALKNTLLSRSGSSDKNRVYDRESQTDIPLTKKALLSAKLAAGIKQSNPSKEGEGKKYRVEVLEPKPMPLTKYGTKAIPMPTASDEIYRLVAKLPDNFPFDEWDEMNTKQQLQTIAGSELTKAEQWVILNAAMPIGTLREIQLIQADDGLGWRSKEQKDNLIAQLWEAGSAIYAVNNNEHSVCYDPVGKKILIDLVYNDKARIEEEARQDLNVLIREAVYNNHYLLGGKEDLSPGTVFNKFKGTMLEKPSLSSRMEDIAESIFSGLGFPAFDVPDTVSIPKTKEHEKVYIFYTSSEGADFTEQAKYQEKNLKRKGYDVKMVCTDNVDSFIEEWNNMSDSTRAAVILSHSNGQSLIFEHNSSDNAISTTGKNSANEDIRAIWELEGPHLEEVFLLACNAGHLGSLENKVDGNVADAIRDLPNVNTVYAYDGSVGFGTPLIREKLHWYDPRKSGEQEIFHELNGSNTVW